MKTITLDLQYDPRSKLHHLSFDAMVPTDEDVCLALRPDAAGVIETRGMVAVRKLSVTPGDVKRALTVALADLPKPETGVVALLLPGTRYEVGGLSGADGIEQSCRTVSTGSLIPLGFAGESLTVTVWYFLLPAWTASRLVGSCAELGVRVVGVEVLMPG